MPDNAVPHLQAQIGKNRIQQRIKRDDRPIVHIIANLPANAAAIAQDAHALGNHLPLLSKIVMEVKTAFVFFSQIVRRGGDDQLDGSGGNLPQHLPAVAFIDNGLAVRFKPW